MGRGGNRGVTEIGPSSARQLCGLESPGSFWMRLRTVISSPAVYPLWEPQAGMVTCVPETVTGGAPCSPDHTGSKTQHSSPSTKLTATLQSDREPVTTGPLGRPAYHGLLDQLGATLVQLCQGQAPLPLPVTGDQDPAAVATVFVTPGVGGVL